MPSKRTLKKWRREKKLKAEAQTWLDSEMRKYEEELKKEKVNG